MIGRNVGKSPIYEIPSSFDSLLEAGPSQKHGTLQNFFEHCSSLTKDSNALVELENMLHQPGKERKDSMVNSFHKKNMGKEICMNI